jgi:hypothetical protein
VIPPGINTSAPQQPENCGESGNFIIDVSIV